MARILPIGIQDFEGIIEYGYIYVDKTQFIYKLAHSGKQYFLSRPRRFGKSLLLSTIKAYWEGKRDLFKGLAIEKLEEGNEKAWQPYPVFYFDFNRDSYEEKGRLEDILDEHVAGWEAAYGCNGSGKILSVRFRNVLLKAKEQTGLRAVILVDEYDKPLLGTMNNNDLEEHNKNVFKGFFSTLKSFDAYIQFVFITGVTKFSKVSIFSDLNQLDDISMTRVYADICGITQGELNSSFEPEIRKLAEEQELTTEECLEKLKRVYDGYRFHQKGSGIYNPFSVLKCFQNREFGYFWFETGTPTFLVKRLSEIGFDVRQFTDKALVATSQDLSDYRGDNPDPVPLLYQTGYLTIRDYDREYDEYILGFPNEEVKYGFLRSLMPEYAPASATRSGNDISSIRYYLIHGDTESLKDAFTALYASIPYTTKNVPYEHYFQSVIYLVFTLLGQHVRCEVHSANGRADAIVETRDFVYLFEFKRDKSADEALEQIDGNEYALPYAADKRTLIKIGAGFDSKKRVLSDWKAVTGDM